MEFRFQKKLCESGVSVIRLPVIETHLGIARDFKFAGPVAMVDQRQGADLGICIGHYTNNTPRLDFAIPSTKLRAIGVKLECVFIRGLRQRLSANRPHAFVVKVANVTKLAPAIARGVFAPAGDVQIAPTAVTGAGGRDHHVVRAVGKQRYRTLRFHFLSFRHCTSNSRELKQQSSSMVAFSEKIARLTSPGSIELLFRDRTDATAVTGSTLSPNDITHHLTARGLQWSHATPRKEPHAFVLIAAVNDINAVAHHSVMKSRPGILSDESEELFPPRIIRVAKNFVSERFEFFDAHCSN
jgi:hypothetical protein